MKRTLSILCAAAMAVTAVGATAVPASAASVTVRSDNHRNNDRRPHFERHGDYAVYNGHKGYKNQRRGYRFYNGYWFPPAAFVIGGILGAILSHAND